MYSTNIYRVNLDEQVMNETKEDVGYGKQVFFFFLNQGYVKNPN